MRTGRRQKDSEENIFNLVAPDPERVVKPKLHKSKFPGNLPPTGSTLGLHSTSAKVANLSGNIQEVVFRHNPYGDYSYWGPHKNRQIKTQKDRKSRSKSPKKSPDNNPFHLPVVSSSHHSPSPEARKPFLPAIDSKPFFGVKNTQDFLQKNREAAKFLTKSQSQARYIEKKTTKVLPETVMKSGQIPNYLIRMKKDRDTQIEEAKKAEFEQEVKNKTLETTNLDYFELAKEDQENLMKNLKSKWNLLNHDYQTLIHRKDFRGTLKKRKEELEEELNKVEGYIKRLDKQTIFINTKDNEEKLPTKNLRAYKSSIKL